MQIETVASDRLNRGEAEGRDRDAVKAVLASEKGRRFLRMILLASKHDVGGDLVPMSVEAANFELGLRHVAQTIVQICKQHDLEGWQGVEREYANESRLLAADVARFEREAQTRAFGQRPPDMLPPRDPPQHQTLVPSL